MKNRLLALTGACLTLAFLPQLPAADLGDPAPALQIAEWVKGSPTNLADGKGKTVFVVEFWATWCAPCRASIPHLTELQKKFKDQGVVFIGVSDENSPTVKKFLATMGAKMDYTVVLDDSRKTSAAYMEAFGVNGIPHAFVIDKTGRIVWHGHPMAGLSRVVAQVAAGKYDIQLAKKRAEAEKTLEMFFELAASGKDEAKVDQMAKELTALDKEVGGILEDEKFDAAEFRKRARFQRYMMEYQAAMAQDDAAKLADLEKLMATGAPSDFKLAEFKAVMQYQKLFRAYYQAVTSTPDAKIAAETAAKIEAIQPKHAPMLHTFAWALLTDEKVTKRDIPFAARLAKGAFESSDGKDAAVLNTHARALFDTGKAAEAVTIQKKALALAGEDERAEYQKALATYEAKAK